MTVQYCTGDFGTYTASTHRRRKGWGYGAAVPPHFNGAP